MIELGINISSDKRITHRMIYQDHKYVGQLIATRQKIEIISPSLDPIFICIPVTATKIDMQQARADVLMEFEQRRETTLSKTQTAEAVEIN